MSKSGRTTKNLLCALVIAGAGMTASVAHAAPIIEWGYTVETKWTGATFTAGTGSQTVNDTDLSWGGAGADPWDGGTNRSGLQIEDVAPQPGSVFTNGGFAPTAGITHYNQAISINFATLNTAELETTLTLSAVNPDPAPNDPLGLAETLTFTIKFTETPNISPCGFPVDTICDDIFVIELGLLDSSFVYDGITYFVSIVDLSGALGPLDDATCAAAGAASGCIGFTTPENQNTTVNFGILVTTAIPAPGALSVLGLGLLGLALGRRRKQKIA